MPDARSEALRTRAKATLEELLAVSTALFEETVPLLRSVESREEAVQKFYQRFERASGMFPFLPYNNFYTANLEARRQNLFSLSGQMSLGFAEYPETQIETHRAEFITFAHEAVTQVFARAKTLYVRVANEAVIVRRLSGYAELLDKLGVAIRLPWAAPYNPKFRNYTQYFPNEASQLAFALPFHRELTAVFDANLNTLRLVHDRLQSLISVVSAMIAELDFADMLAEPTVIPQTLVMLTNIDNSTTLAEGTSIRDSAIGSSSTRSR